MEAWVKTERPMSEFWSSSPAQFEAYLQARSPKKKQKRGGLAELFGVARLHPGVEAEVD